MIFDDVPAPGEELGGATMGVSNMLCLSGAEDQKKEGKQLCIDLIQELREIEGVSGVHVMAYRQEEAVAEIIDRSGVLQRRVP